MCIAAGTNHVCSTPCGGMEACPLPLGPHQVACWGESICVLSCQEDSDCFDGMVCEQFCMWP